MIIIIHLYNNLKGYLLAWPQGGPLMPCSCSDPMLTAREFSDNSLNWTAPTGILFHVRMNTDQSSRRLPYALANDVGICKIKMIWKKGVSDRDYVLLMTSETFMIHMIALMSSLCKGYFIPCSIIMLEWVINDTLLFWYLIEKLNFSWVCTMENPSWLFQLPSKC